MSAVLYKVLVNGQSCHGGAHTWALPTFHHAANVWSPGAWQEYDGQAILCERGFHLTTDPAQWWKDGCTVYEAEASEAVDRNDDRAKLVVVRARLLRPVRMVKIPGGWTIEQQESRSSGWADPKRAE